MKKHLSIIILGLSPFLFSCEKKEEDTSCTLEFRIIGVAVKGDSLTDFYTVRESNSDTIRFLETQSFTEEIWYPILDDTYLSSIKNNVAMFRFVGEVDDSIVINQEYTIEADNCHINRLEGPSEISL